MSNKLIYIIKCPAITHRVDIPWQRLKIAKIIHCHKNSNDHMSNQIACIIHEVTYLFQMLSHM